MINIYVTYTDKSEIKELKELESDLIKFNFLNSLSKNEKKKAYQVKSHWGAKLDPFAIVMNGEIPIKAFYSEADDVIENLIDYINQNKD